MRKIRSSRWDAVKFSSVGAKRPLCIRDGRPMMCGLLLSFKEIAVVDSQEGKLQVDGLIDAAQVLRADGLNAAARVVFDDCAARATELQIELHTLASGTRLLDFGVATPGGLAAGVQFAKICLAGQADVRLSSGDRQIWPGTWVQVSTDFPVQACMFGQYAGWPVKHDDFFAMGSGPMRVRRGKEQVLEDLLASDSDSLAVGTLECDQLPSAEVLSAMAEQCQVPQSSLCIAVAPTRSVAGCVQVVARSVETSLHKLHELGFPLTSVRGAHGYAPLCPPTPDFALGIGRTNDAILYGGHVSLWVDSEDALVESVVQKLPSCASRDFGEPFSEIFKRNEYDFYKIDPGLFSPAEVFVMNQRTGSSWKFGELRGDLVMQSFGTKCP